MNSKIHIRWFPDSDTGKNEGELFFFSGFKINITKIRHESRVVKAFMAFHRLFREENPIFMIFSEISFALIPNFGNFAI